MLIKIDDVFCQITNNDREFCVHFENHRYSAPSLVELIQRLESFFKEISLHPNCYTDDFSKLNFCIRLGFRHLENRQISIDGKQGVLSPACYQSSRENGAESEAGRKHLRLYMVRITPTESYILSEPEVDAIIGRQGF